MCPPTDELLNFIAGQLSPERSSAIEVHMDVCAECRATVSSLVIGSVPEPQFGRYRVETVIGEGGMGIVYRAFDPQLERAVAIKVVKTSDNEEALRARLLREAQSLARLSHPNVCQVYDAGRDGEEVWVAMELIKGVNLRLWAGAHSASEIEDALIQAARGIAAAHAVGLIHRDVKPENVLVTHIGRTVVTDFGLARGADGTITSTSVGSASGTPAYMAPEQLTASPLDARVDQFAWAVMAWELLAGERPFPVEAAARLAAIRAGVIPPHRLPARVVGVLTRALTSTARDRFASMEALLDALTHPALKRPWRRAVAVSAVVFFVGLALLTMMVRERGLDHTRAAVSIVPVSGPPLPPPPDAYVTVEAATPIEPLAIAPSPTRAAEVPGRSGFTHPVTPTASAAPQRSPRRPPTAMTSSAASTVPATRDGQIPVATPPDAAAVAPPAAIRPVETHAAPPAGAPQPAERRTRFDRARAERILADCRFPIDPARPERALAGLGAIVDWGLVTGRESLRGPDGLQHVIYEILGSRDLYRIDAGSMPQLGVLEAAVGDRIVVCPYERPGRYRPPLMRTVYAFAPADVIPRIAGELRDLAPLHIPEGMLRAWSTGIPLHLQQRSLLVWARPSRIAQDSWDMSGWTLDATEMNPDELAQVVVRSSMWLVVDRPRLEGSPANRRVIVRGVRALPSLLR